MPRLINRLFRRSPNRASEFRRLVAEFLEEIDTRVRVFELDPDLEEIAMLKRDAPSIIGEDLSRGSTYRNLYLKWLNPYLDVSLKGDGSVVVQERWFGHILHPWSLAEFHLKHWELGEKIQRIVVNSHGTHVFVDNDHRLILYLAGICNPHRMADPGNRLRVAAGIVRHHTGIDLDWRDLAGKYSATFVKTEDGWTQTLSEDPATAVAT
jgi:hypothetical protein